MVALGLEVKSTYCFEPESFGSAILFGLFGEGSEINVCTDSAWFRDVLNNEPITDSNQSQLIFSVRTCEHVRLIFYERKLRPSYELIIGRKQNTLSRIKICAFEECFQICPDNTDDNCHIYENTDIDTEGILDCNEFRWFWVSWNTSFCFGRGKEIGKEEIKSVNLVDIVINYIGLTVRQNVSGKKDEWIFDSDSQSFTINEDLLCNKNSNSTPNFTGTTKTSGSNSEDTTTDLSLVNSTESLTYSTTTYGKTTTDGIIKTTTLQTTKYQPRMADYNCVCPCSKVNNQNLTNDELLQFLSEHLEELKQVLQIDPKSTKAAQAKKMCAPDDRNSSQIMGWLGSIVIGIGVGFLVLSDITRFLHYLTK
ncbi:unnamed protein product [Mytilus coruscus]|uniref:Farnesoic acid O-methyl transferase domain-containing protein n=1 Tax=Mytilus coruscus TaxID=42192 RepID=A0A6J8EIU7_MYTCO|nr:unnamed protein product [Mytilus coruscus]